MTDMTERVMRRLGGRKGRPLAVIGLAVVSVGAAAWLPLVANPGPPPRDIRLVARDMTLYLEGQTTANPTLRVRSGEEIRFVLRNADPGLTHSLEIESFGVAIGPLHSGETGEAVFRVPNVSGEFGYVCSPHAQMMRGRVEVVGDESASAPR